MAHLPPDDIAIAFTQEEKQIMLGMLAEKIAEYKAVIKTDPTDTLLLQVAALISMQYKLKYAHGA